MFRRGVFVTVLLFCAGFCCFAQTGILRDYVGLINQTFHPDIVAYMGKFRDNLDRRGDREAARSIDSYLKGGSGTGFVYVGKDGANYIITNYHVISQSYDISVTFEKPDGARLKYEGLDIIAADEDMDIALLAFAEGQRPFASGLAFLERPVDEGEDVYSAGFPGLGNVTLWQFGRGMVSNAHVTFPAGDDDTDKMMGPYIQHTAQVDPGNSGGPLLVQKEGVPSGYAVVGINTLSARFRQAANFSIPMDRVQSFLDAALGPVPADDRARLDARVDSFITGLRTSKVAYEHIAKYLSNACIAENAEFAISEVLRRSTAQVERNVIEAFSYSPVEGMNYAVAWTIEDSLRSGSGLGAITVSVDEVLSSGEGFIVSFKVSNKTISSTWVREFGIWRIGAFGDFAAGDKTLVEKREQERRDEENLRAFPYLQFSAGLAFAVGLRPTFAADFKIRSDYFAGGLKFFTKGAYFTQVETLGGVYIPITVKGNMAFTPFADLAVGLVFERWDEQGIGGSTPRLGMGVDFSLQGGLMFTTSVVPGLYLQAAYQYNFYAGSLDDYIKKNPHMIIISVGYSL